MSVVASFSSRTSLARHLTHELGALGAAEKLYYVNIRFALAKLQLFGLAT